MEENKKKESKKEKKKSKYDGLTVPQKIKKALRSKLCGVILSGIQLIATIVLLAQVLYLNVLPVKFFVPLAFILLMLVGYTFLTVQSRKFITLGKILSLVMIIICIVGVYYVGKVNGMFDNISGHDEKIDIMNVYVLKDNPAKDIESAKDYTFGILANLDREFTDQTIEKVEKNVGQDIDIAEYEGWTDLVDALYNGDVQAIILKEAYADVISETEGFETFADDVRVLLNNKIVTKLQVDTSVDISKDPFIVYISGNDNYGSISINGRSDVNILAVINPDTRQILLVNTPRDYYVQFSNNGQMDKLTHAGIFGVDVSMATLGNLYDIDVNYYFKVNFAGFEKVIDALGGVDVESEYEFTTYHGGYYIKKGINHLNGKQALGFCRERYAFSTGDNQRGKNQMALIQGVIKSMASSALLNDFSGLMEGLEGSFATSLTSTQISALVRMQLNEGGSWNVVSYSAYGEGGNDWCYSLGAANYVMYPYEGSIKNVNILVNQVLSGKTIDLSAAIY